jgi:hypothetical protein
LAPQDIAEETVSPAQQRNTSLVPRGNEGEQKYGSKNLDEEICENKSVFRRRNIYKHFGTTKAITF